MSAKRPQDWTAEEKLAAVIEAAAVAEEDLGGFLRRQGLHEAQLNEWRRQVLASLGKPPARSSKRSVEARRVKELEKELHRKDKALAETAALLVLQKKVQALWGDGDDTTAQKNGR
jgi:transposase-like protein